MIAKFNDLRPHLLRREEGKCDLTVPLSVEELVSNDAQRPDVNFLIIEIVGVDLWSIEAKSPDM
jgi:hypothetical protein